MKNKSFIKKTVFMLACMTILIMIDISIMQGGIFVPRQSIETPKRAELADNGLRGAPPEANIKVKSFSAAGKESDGLFRIGVPIELTCVVENGLEKPVKNFRSLMRTPMQEITEVKTKNLGARQEITLKGTFTPQNTGVNITACRADVDGQISEASENDNREILAIYAGK